MKPAVGIVVAAIALTSVRAGKPLVGVKSPEPSSDDASASSSWDFSWNASDSTEASGSGYSCDEICPTKYDPVCGSDGVTYVNDCALSIAQCNTTELTLMATGECAGGSISSSVEGSKSGSSDMACPGACLDVYDPVSDESGKTYSNECYMRMAKCKDTKKDVDVLAEYKRLYGRSFGASRDDSVGDDSASEASGSSSAAVKGTKAPKKAGKSSKATKSTKAPKTTKTSSTSGVGSLFEDGSSGVIGSDSSSSSSNCAGACPDIYSPVCGSDGVTYSSSCQLELASCQNPKLDLSQASEDVCSGSEATTTQQETVSKDASKSTKTTA
ncbi:hypothetical protein PRIC2_002428 [Phytophthora ramorum]